MFEDMAYALPFVHAAELEKDLFAGEFALAATHILPIVGYSALVTVVAVALFLRQMKRQ